MDARSMVIASLFLFIFITCASAADEPCLSVKLSLEPPFSLSFSGKVELFYHQEGRLEQKPNLKLNSWSLVNTGELKPNVKWQVHLAKGKIILSSESGDRISSELPLMLRSSPGDGIEINGWKYPGALQLWPTENLLVFNELELEEYVVGVLGCEAYAGWSVEALKANAVAIRTYTLYGLGKHQEYDLCDQVHCQIYRGSRLSSVFKEAVLACKGEVLTWQGDLINAVYHSSSGGRTRNNEEVWTGSPLPYLRAVEDFDHQGRNFHWPQAYLFSRGELAKVLGFSGEQGIEVIPACSEAGQRLGFNFRSEHNGEEKQFKNESLRWLFSFPSANFRVFKVKERAIQEGVTEDSGFSLGTATINNQEIRLTVSMTSKIKGEEITQGVNLGPTDRLLFIGTGSGHGVGLSQWGAAALAEKGYNYKQILRHYYGDEVRLRKYGE
mgnify:FL=1